MKITKKSKVLEHQLDICPQFDILSSIIYNRLFSNMLLRQFQVMWNLKYQTQMPKLLDSGTVHILETILLQHINLVYRIYQIQYLYYMIRADYNCKDIPIDLSKFQARLTLQNLKKHKIRIITQNDNFLGGMWIKYVSIKQNANIINLKVIISKFQLDISIYFRNKKSPHKNNQNYARRANINNCLGIGGFGTVYLESSIHKIFAVKSQSIGQQKTYNHIYHEIIDKIRQVSIYKICSLYGIGSMCIMYDCFDLICYEDCIQFNLQHCQNIKSSSSISEQLKQNMEMLHLFRIIHKDIKPSNILYSNIYQRCIFIDFGLAQCINQKKGEKTKTKKEGTIGYMLTEMEQLKQNQQIFADLYDNDNHCRKKTEKQILQIQVNIKAKNEQYIYCQQQYQISKQGRRVDRQKIQENRQYKFDKKIQYQFLILKSIATCLQYRQQFQQINVDFLKDNNQIMYQILDNLLYDCEQIKIKDCIVRKIEQQFKNNSSYLENKQIQRKIDQIKISIIKKSNPKRPNSLCKDRNKSQKKHKKQVRNRNYKRILGQKYPFQIHTKKLLLLQIQYKLVEAKMNRDQDEELMQYLYILDTIKDQQQKNEILQKVQKINASNRFEFQEIMIQIYKMQPKNELQDILQKIGLFNEKKSVHKSDILNIYFVLLKRLYQMAYYQQCERIIQKMESIETDKFQLFYQKFSNVYKKLGKFSKAYEYATKLLQFYTNTSAQTYLILTIQYQRADIHILRKNYKLARQILHQMLIMYDDQYQQNQSIALIKIYNLLIQVEVQSKNVQEVIKLLKKSDLMMVEQQKQWQKFKNFLQQKYKYRFYEKRVDIYLQFVQFYIIIINYLKKRESNQNKVKIKQYQLKVAVYLEQIGKLQKRYNLNINISIIYYYQCAHYQRFRGQYREAINLAQISLNKRLESNSLLKLPENYCQLISLYIEYSQAKNYWEQQHTLKVQTYLRECMKLLQKYQYFIHNDFELIQKITSSLINLIYYNQAIRFVTQILKLLQYINQSTFLIGRCHASLGQLYCLQNTQHDKSLYHLQKSLHIYEQQSQIIYDGFKAKNYYYLAVIYSKKQQFDRSIQQLKIAIQLFTKIKNDTFAQMCKNLQNLIRSRVQTIQKSIQQVDKKYQAAISLNLKDKIKAIKLLQIYLQQYIKLYKTQHHIKILKTHYELSKRYFNIKDLKKANEHAVKYQQIQKIVKSSDPNLLEYLSQIKSYEFIPYAGRYLKKKVIINNGYNIL